VTSNSAFRGDLEIDFPTAIGVGSSWRLRSNLTASADYTRTFWSGAEIRNWYFLGAAPTGATEGPEPDVYGHLAYPDIQQGEGGEQADTEQLRAGVEYVILRGGLKVPLRAGYFSNQPVLRPAGRIPRFNGVSVGAGILLGPVLIDGAYLYEFGRYLDTVSAETSSAASTRVTVKSHRFFASVIYRYGGRP
jgi:hypothetical protein